MSKEEWVKKMWYKMVAFYSITMKNEIMQFVRKWIELDVTMLSKTNQTHKDITNITNFISYVESRTYVFILAEKRGRLFSGRKWGEPTERRGDIEGIGAEYKQHTDYAWVML